MVHASVPPVRPTRANQSTLESHSGLELAFVFWSVATGTARDDRDLDIAVQAAQPLSSSQKMALIGDLAEAMGRPVDLIDLRTVWVSRWIATDEDLQDVPVLNLSRAVQLCVDIAAHLLADSKQPVPATMG